MTQRYTTMDIQLTKIVETKEEEEEGDDRVSDGRVPVFSEGC